MAIDSAERFAFSFMYSNTQLRIFKIKKVDFSFLVTMKHLK